MTVFRQNSHRLTTSRTSAGIASNVSPPRSGSSATSDSTKAPRRAITAPDPEKLDHFWVDPVGMKYKFIRIGTSSSSTITARW